MTIVFIIFILLILYALKFKKKSDENDYLNKSQTSNINGIFIIIVFFSHFYGYYSINNLELIDKIPAVIVGKLGQLMVTPFLFFSGYGIYYSIKSKKNYVDDFFKNRFMPTWINFVIAILLFLILNFVMNNKYDLITIILSFVGYESIGNSNWYMFDIFVLYIFTIISFSKIFYIKNNERKSLMILTILTIIYIILFRLLKETWFVDTLLCYPFGMIYCYYKEKIDIILSEQKKYLISLIVIVLLFTVIYFLPYNIIKFNVESVLFMSIICLLSKKIIIENNYLNWLGKKLFWIYILQRIPMIILCNKMSNRITTCFVLCMFLTIILAWIVSNVTSLLLQKLNLVKEKN